MERIEGGGEGRVEGRGRGQLQREKGVRGKERRGILS